MEPEPKSMGLFQDILTLEKEYNYNVIQLKVKHDDLERCRSSNITLQEIVNKSLEEIKRLKAEIRALEDSAEKTKHAREAEKSMCEEIIKKLTIKINEVKHEKERSEVEMKRRFCEHTQKSEEHEKSQANKIRELQEDLQQTTATITKLNMQIKQLVDSNMELQNKIRETEAKFIPELAIYKREADFLKRANTELTTSNESFKAELNRTATQLISKHNILTSHEGIIRKLSSENAELRNREENVRRLTSVNNGQNKILQEQVRNCRCGELSRNNKMLQEKMRDCRCEELTRQNKMLQEVVKSLKNERDVKSRTTAGEFSEAEIRVGRVEDLLFQLKKSMIENASLEFT